MIRRYLFLFSIVCVSGCGQIAAPTAPTDPADPADPAVAGGWIAFIGGGTNENLVIQLIRPDGSSRKTVMPDADPRSDFSGHGWSPDGSQLVFSSNLGGNAKRDTGWHWDIVVVNLVVRT